MCLAALPAIVVDNRRKEHDHVWWGIGFGIFFYLVLAITLGVMTLRKGHWVMFILGIFLPIFWLIGAIMPPTHSAQPSY
jgi:hypothetical protein